MMKHCVQQTPDGYYLTTGDFDVSLNDYRINKANFVGRSWLDVERATSGRFNSDRVSASVIEHVELQEDLSSSVPSTKVPELEQLVEAGILSSSYQLLPKQSRRSIVEYCHEHNLFKPWHLEDWRRIGGLISDRSGRKISASSLKQSYQDYQKNSL